MRESELKKVIEEILKENEGAFTEEEHQIISNNFNLVKKIYLIGLIHARQIYK